MTGAVRACANYFRVHPGYHRLLTALMEKYRRSGRPAGWVTLSDASTAECEAARALFGRPFEPPLRFRADQFEEALQQTRFRGVSLKAVLEDYFGTELKTRREVRAGLEDRFAAVLDRAMEGRGETTARWLEDLRAGRGSGYTLLRREATRDPGQTGTGLMGACAALDRLERGDGRPVRLAVLSAGATSDPHALDSGTLGGKLFLHLLAYRSGLDYPASAEKRDALYYQNGILCDSISSLVTQVGLILETEGGEHPGYALFRQRREPVTLSLASLSALTGVRSPCGRAFLVENEMVFAQLCDRADHFCAPLLCTSGQPSVAALRLLDLLAASGTALFYSGDFDGKGLSIAAQLWRRCPERLTPWHMGPEDYEKCRSEVALSAASRALLQNCAGTPLEPAARAVEAGGTAGYQELLLPWLEEELLKKP